MSEEPKQPVDYVEEKKQKKYDPRAEYEWVPMLIVIALTATKIALVLMPYYAAAYLTTEQSAIMASIVTDQGFDMVWLSSITYWIGRRTAQETNK